MSEPETPAVDDDAEQDLQFAEFLIGRATLEPIGGRFTDLSLLSLAGFTSVVFLATDLRTGRKAVLKFLKPWTGDYWKASFKREADAARKLIGRENIVQLVADYDKFVFQLQDPITGKKLLVQCQYYALEVGRETLTAALYGKRRARGLYRRLEFGREIAKGVNRLHGAGYCHRDLKPDNILLFSKGVVKVADLGTCRLHSGADPIGDNYVMPAGDKNYAAPEMFNGGGEIPSLYIAADWFGVGAILFEAVCGQNLYVAIGLRGPNEIVDALAVGRTLKEYETRVAEISGRYPIPGTLEFASEPWLTGMSEETHTAVSSLLRDLCNFDHQRRLISYSSIRRRIDICIRRARADSPGWRRNNRRDFV